VFFLILGALAISNAGGSDLEPKYTASEIIMIADNNLEKKDYERALTLYQSVRYRFPENDPRTKVIIEKIEKAKKLMASEF
jgi:outer membrane protein assembly factor BamD (BamD/ComL family)